MRLIKGSFTAPVFQVILFSWVIAFAAAYIITPFFPSQEDYSFLTDPQKPDFKPAYALFSSLLSATAEPLNEETDIESLTNSFVTLCLKARFVEENLGKNQNAMLTVYLKEVVDSDDPFIKEKAANLTLRHRYHSGDYTGFLQAYLPLEDRSDSLIPLWVNALIMTRDNTTAQSAFTRHFDQITYRAWSNTLSSSTLTQLLRALPEEIWHGHLDALLRNNQLSEADAWLRLRSSPERAQLLTAFRLYGQKAYAQCQTALERIKSPALTLWKEYLRLKSDARLGRIENIEIRSLRYRNAQLIYLTLLSDLGGILIATDNESMGLEFYQRYINEIDTLVANRPSTPFEQLPQLISLQEHAELYWQIVYRCAWLHFKLDKRGEYERLLQRCLFSEINSIRQSARSWLSNPPQEGLSQITPFGYDFVRLKGTITPDHLIPFLELIATPQTISETEQSRLVDLTRFALYDEAAEYCRWLRERQADNPQLRHSLAICEAIVRSRQGRHALAFITYRDALPDHSRLVLPRYLAAIVLPLDHQEHIRSEAQKNGLDPLLVTSLIRQESFFRSDATSSANAYGLMQLLLRTARETDSSDLTLTHQDLFNPSQNIALGCRYLKGLMDRYQNRMHLALAAYNAGPERVDLWLSQLGQIPDDEFIELIPFSETRLYVKNIVRNIYFYRYYYPEQFPPH